MTIKVLDNGRVLSQSKKSAENAGRDQLEYYGSFKAEAGFTIEKKSSGEGGMWYEGHASVFGNIDSYNDIVDAGAFKNTIAERGPKEVDGKISSLIISLWQHNPDWPFGMPHHIEEDSKGLYHRTRIADTAENRDRIVYMNDGIVSRQSIGFMTLDAELEDEEDYWSIRHLKEIMLFEFSPVSFAANEEAMTTAVHKSRELARAVAGTDHGRILELASKTKGIFLPEIETAISVLTQFTKSHKSIMDEPMPETDAGSVDLLKEIEKFASTLTVSAYEEPESIRATVDLSLRADDEGYKANSSMKPPARQALAWKEDGKPGGTAVGIKRAHQIVDGEAMSLSTVKRVKQFFDRHQSDRDADGFNSGEEGYPSKGRVAWNLWGSDPGWKWATAIVEKEGDKDALIAEWRELDIEYVSLKEIEELEAAYKSDGEEPLVADDEDEDEELKALLEEAEIRQYEKAREERDRFQSLVPQGSGPTIERGE